MDYQLFEKSDLARPVATRRCEDDFAAHLWGLEWTTANGKVDEYCLERQGGGFSALLVRTVGGQWYVLGR